MKLNKSQYYLFLNPYSDMAFTKCPQCDRKTKVRKKPFVVSVEPMKLLTLHLSGKYCEKCDLIILHRDKLEYFMAIACEKNKMPEIIGNKYFVMGTVTSKDFKDAESGKIKTEEFLKKLIPLKGMEHFEVQPAGWYPADS